LAAGRAHGLMRAGTSSWPRATIVLAGEYSALLFAGGQRGLGRQPRRCSSTPRDGCRIEPRERNRSGGIWAGCLNGVIFALHEIHDILAVHRHVQGRVNRGARLGRVERRTRRQSFPIARQEVNWLSGDGSLVAGL
jgi:hypothetical protein